MNFNSDSSIPDKSKRVRGHNLFYAVTDSRGGNLHCQYLTLLDSKKVSPPPQVFSLFGETVPLLNYFNVVAQLTKVSQATLCGRDFRCHQ